MMRLNLTAPFCLVLSSTALGGNSLFSAEASRPSPSAYSFYLSAKSLESRQQPFEAWRYWQSLVEVAALPRQDRLSVAGHLTHYHGYTLAKAWLKAQSGDATEDLALDHEFDFHHYPRSETWQETWSQQVLQSIQQHPQSLALHTLLQTYSTHATALPVALPDTLEEAQGVAYFRSLQNRMSLGEEAKRASHLNYLLEVLTELETKAYLGKNPLSDWFYLIIDFHLAIGDLEKAQLQLTKQLATWPEDQGLLKRLYRLQGANHQWEEAKLTFATLRTTGPLALEDYVLHASALQEARDYHGEVACLLEGIRHHTAPYALFERVNQAYLKLSDAQRERLEFAKRTVARFPEQVSSHYYLGLSLFHQNEPSASIPQLQKVAHLAAAQNPELLKVPFFHALGLSHAALGQRELARRALEAALRIEGNEDAELRAESSHHIATWLMEEDMHSSQAGIRAQQAVNWSPEEIRYHLTLATWQLHNAPADKVLATLKACEPLLALTPQAWSPWCELLVRAHLKQGQPEAAQQAIEAFKHQLSPLQREALRQLLPLKD